MPHFHEGWGNPLNELIRKENATCKGCEHLTQEKAFGIIINFCTKGRKVLKRCKSYKEKE